MLTPSLLAFALFAFVTSITPGPNNLMLLTSGLRFGFRKSLPHMLGISIGFFAMVVILGTGASVIFERFPRLMQWMHGLSLVYFAWLAWGLLTAPPADAPAETTAQHRPLGFWGAAAFQWVNPKAWLMALGAISAYIPGSNLLALTVFAGIFALINFPSIAVWVLAGTRLQTLLTRPRHHRCFNGAMVLLLVISVVY
ncbi:LysE family translocator [Leeia oryzae]|uniref:LysE family translocator n=1 Tax=Leeia oryzae TaxID=356662 RepID=UPI000475B5DB|nr:LysE family translocator [Leeia oryzae]